MKSINSSPKSIFFYNFGGDTSWDGVVSAAYREASRQEGHPPIVQDFSFSSVPRLGRLGLRPKDLFPSSHKVAMQGRISYRGYKRRISEFNNEQHGDWLRSSVQSALCSLLRDDEPKGTMAVRLKGRLERTGKITFLWALDLFKQFPEIEIVYIPNGRFPNQKAIEIASNLMGRTVRFYERGVGNSIFLQDFAPLNINRRVDFLTGSFAESAASDPRVQGMDDRYKNFANKSSFGSRWKPSTSPAFNYVFFTSSQDEFWYLGEDWKSQFASQFAAIESFVNAALKNDPGSRIAIRMHPNTLTKSVQYAWREGKFFFHLSQRFPANVRVFWPNSSQDSYQLARSTDRVIVWNSTIGLEALAMGKAVATCAPSEYINVFQQSRILEDVTDSLKNFQFLRLREDSRKNAVAFLQAQERLYTSPNGLDLKSNRRFIWILFLRDLLGLGVAVSSVVDPKINRIVLATLDFYSRTKGSK